MTWPPVFDGIGALVVRCDLDPAALVAKIRAKTPGLSWIAPKVNGSDITGPADIAHCVEVWRSLGLEVGSWAYCDGPPAIDAHAAYPSYYAPAFIVYDVEAEYKGHADWPAQLVAEHQLYSHSRPGAVTSYGAIPGWGNFPSDIDFEPFASAGWPIIAQSYDGYTVPQARTYSQTSGQPIPGPYPAAGVHTMVRSLALAKSQAVYRPESIDG